MTNLLTAGFIELVDHMGNDESIVRAARVSHAANEKTGQDPVADAKLIRYLYTNQHTTPFEHVVFAFHVKAPIFVFRQWHRHRTWSFNEVSARYTELPEEFYVPLPQHFGQQSSTNHQARDIDEVDTESDGYALGLEAGNIQWEINTAAFDAYKQFLAGGIPREVARAVLPVATYSEMYATVDLHNLFHFLTLRCDAHAQYEIRVYAEAIVDLIRPIVPVAVEAWEKSVGRGA